VRNSRVLARRAGVLLRRRHLSPDGLAEAIAGLAEATRCLGEELAAAPTR